MTRIKFPHERDDGIIIYVELIECSEMQWAQFSLAESGEWSVCEPEPGSPDRLVRATRLLGPDSTRGQAPILRLAVGT
jgi:hypothetical protein